MLREHCTVRVFINKFIDKLDIEEIAIFLLCLKQRLHWQTTVTILMLVINVWPEATDKIGNCYSRIMMGVDGAAFQLLVMLSGWLSYFLCGIYIRSCLGCVALLTSCFNLVMGVTLSLLEVEETPSYDTINHSRTTLDCYYSSHCNDHTCYE